MNIKEENIEYQEEAIDLRTYEAIARESEDRHKLNPTVRLTKRRQEFETYYSGEVKKLKQEENKMIVKLETPENEVNEPNVQFPQHTLQGLTINMPMVQIPQYVYPLRNFGSGIADISDIMLIPFPALKNEPVFEDFPTVSSYQMSTNVISNHGSLAIKEEPADGLETTTSSQSAHIQPISENIIIKQESTDHENISSNLTNDDDVYVSSSMETALLEIGPHGTCISKKNLESINWMEASSATRKLLALIFDRQTLASHSLSGKPAPTFLGCERPSKAQLDPLKVADIIYFMQQKANCSEKVIRQAITAKCADTAKIVRRSLSRKK